MGRMLKMQVAVLILLPLLFGGAVFLFSKLVITPKYSSTATVVVRGTSIDNQNMQYEDVLASQSLAKMVVSVAKSREIAAEVSAALNDPAINADILLDSVKVTLLPDSSIISIEYTDAEAVRAARVANEYITVLKKEVPVYYKGAVLTPFDVAVPPNLSSKPNMVLNTLAGVLAGICLAMIAAYALANSDQYG